MPRLELQSAVDSAKIGVSFSDFVSGTLCLLITFLRLSSNHLCAKGAGKYKTRETLAANNDKGTIKQSFAGLSWIKQLLTVLPPPGVALNSLGPCDMAALRATGSYTCSGYGRDNCLALVAALTLLSIVTFGSAESGGGSGAAPIVLLTSGHGDEQEGNEGARAGFELLRLALIDQGMSAWQEKTGRPYIIH